MLFLSASQYFLQKSFFFLLKSTLHSFRIIRWWQTYYFQFVRDYIFSLKWWWLNYIDLFLKRFYLLIFTEGKWRRKRGRETSMCGCLSHTHNQGPGLQPRHVPWLGIERPFGSQAGVQSTEPHQPGLYWLILSQHS